MGRSRTTWGWHELTPRRARELVEAADLPRRSVVVDVGAGRGAITGPLVDAGHRVIAVEVHRGRADHLRRRFGDAITLVRTDARTLRLPRRPFHVVSSPPYAISSPLLRLLLQRGSRLESAVLVLQTQTARRWTAGAAPGSGRWLREFELTLGRSVPRSAFRPPPQVPSSELRIRRRR